MPLRNRYIIGDGQVQVRKPDGMLLAVLGRGTFFGEMALLSDDMERRARVTAISICDIYILRKADLETIFALQPELREDMLAVANNRKQINAEKRRDNNGASRSSTCEADSAPDSASSFSSDRNLVRRCSLTTGAKTTEPASPSKGRFMMRSKSRGHSRELPVDALAEPASGRPSRSSRTRFSRLSRRTSTSTTCTTCTSDESALAPAPSGSFNMRLWRTGYANPRASRFTQVLGSYSNRTSRSCKVAPPPMQSQADPPAVVDRVVDDLPAAPPPPIDAAERASRRAERAARAAGRLSLGSFMEENLQELELSNEGQVGGGQDEGETSVEAVREANTEENGYRDGIESVGSTRSAGERSDQGTMEVASTGSAVKPTWFSSMTSRKSERRTSMEVASCRCGILGSRSSRCSRVSIKENEIYNDGGAPGAALTGLSARPETVDGDSNWRELLHTERQQDEALVESFDSAPSQPLPPPRQIPTRRTELRSSRRITLPGDLGDPTHALESSLAALDQARRAVEAALAAPPAAPATEAAEGTGVGTCGPGAQRPAATAAPGAAPSRSPRALPSVLQHASALSDADASASSGPAPAPADSSLAVVEL